MIDPKPYALQNTDDLQTPALVYYREMIEHNTRVAIERAGDAARLWPHVKSHKMASMIRIQQEMGIERFKCATIAEAQMVAECDAHHILLAYPLVGPNIGRFLRLQHAYPDSHFYAIGEDWTQLALLSEAATAAGQQVSVLLDVNMGMNRTGVALDDTLVLYRRCAGLDGLSMSGLHCYDGHVHDPDFQDRVRHAQSALEKAHGIRDALIAEGTPCELLVMGGTPTFPVHAQHKNVYLSPGTVFLSDAKCMRNVSDLDIIPAAGVWTRVISHPAEGMFTLDLGSKGISTDQPDGRGIVVGCEEATPLFQSEEHWVFQMPEGKPVPPIGAMFFVIPMHICPTTALYPYAHVASGGFLADRWEVTARDRNIGI